MRIEFLQRFTQALQALDGRLGAAGIAHARYVLDEPLERPLQHVFGRHNKA